MDVKKGDYWIIIRIRIIAFPPQIDCEQTAMGLPPITSAEFLTA
jgi:hypothetical protein